MMDGTRDGRLARLGLTDAIGGPPANTRRASRLYPKK